ncbi:glycosyltransferase family 39 protein [Candidatus Microgenomates bacterium]|nr:glycosyltransferase family 39 protein [Candidatus Microgenomates bacterium]
MQRIIDFFIKNKFLVLIIILAALLRFYNVTQLPPALNWDEISHGVNAYSILKTGQDEWGVTLPTIFRAYGDYKLPVYIYSLVPFIAIFGLNEFSVRVVSVLAGLGTIIFTYLLVQTLLKKQEISILSAFFVAIEPWDLFLSRVAVEANLALFLTIAGSYFFVSGLSNRWRLFIGITFFGLSVWTYNSVRIFVPLLMISLLIIYRNYFQEMWEKQRKTIAYCLLPIALLFLPMFWQLLNPVGLARYGWVGILDEGAISQINKERNTSKLPSPLPLLLHNKVTFVGEKFIQNYFSYFSPSFLFFNGGSQYQFNIPGKGLIYPTELAFIIIGLIWLVKNKNKESLLILSWLFFSPIAASVTREAPHALRSIVMQPMPQLLAAIGLVIMWKWITKKNFQLIAIVFYIVLLAAFFENYITTYAGKYRVEYSWSWQYGYKEAVRFIKDNYNSYDQIIMTKKYGEPHEFILFYWPWDPANYINDPNLIRFGQSNWFWIDRFDKFYFVNDWQIPSGEDGKWKMESGGEVPTSGRTILITSPSNYPPDFHLIKTINFLDGKPAFDILEKI